MVQKMWRNLAIVEEVTCQRSCLKIVDPRKDCVVCTYACIEGLGGVLMQKGFVIFYKSRKIKEHEKNYATHDL